ncbi:MAG: PQQ-binding-like beta-propeller repeat protein, partial [Chloroflexi bacterium]|nr:PQQ-binding-like beta-propeller repeat protein [Chloroflexota bacterium]
MDSEGRWQPMVEAGQASASALVPLDPLVPGHHVVDVRLVLPLPADRREESHDQGGYGGDCWTTSLPLDLLPSHGITAAAFASPALTEVWRKKIGGAVQSKLLYAGGTVYVASADGRLYAFSAGTGHLRWAFDTGGALYGTPLLNDGLLYIASMSHFVYAVDPGTGALRWRTRLGGPIFAGVQVGDGIACVGAGDSTIYGLDARSGVIRWTYQTKGFIQQQAAFGEGAFYVGAWDNGFYAVEAQTGKLRWRKQFGRSFFYSPSIGAPAVYGGRVYVPSDDDTLHAVVMRTGDVAWETHSPDGAGSFGYSGPAVTPDGRIFIAALGDTGTVVCLDSRNGSLLWRTDTHSVIYDSSCAVAGQVVTVGSVDGTV